MLEVLMVMCRRGVGGSVLVVYIEKLSLLVCVHG